MRYTSMMLVALASLATPLAPATVLAAEPLSHALETTAVRLATWGENTGFDGVVEAVRQTVLAVQVSGAIVELRVRAGDMVKAGQVLARLDARAAEQSAVAGQAQAQAARAMLDVASKDFARQKQLFDKGFISRAALDAAEATYKSAESQMAAQIAQAGATRTQSDFYVLRAPYSGVVSEVPVVLGDMATPGRPILTLYDPALLRVTAAIPESVVISAAARQAARVELPDAAGVLQSIKPGLVTVLPAVDAGSHTWQIRLDLPAGTVNAVPGKFARVWLSVQRAATEPEGRVFVPAKSVVRRAELTGVYVVDAAGRPSLRQVRLGRASGDAIEVLSGLTAGERVATDPQAAARLRPTP